MIYVSTSKHNDNDNTTSNNIYIYVYVYTHTHIYIYIYIYICGVNAGVGRQDKNQASQAAGGAPKLVCCLCMCVYTYIYYMYIERDICIYVYMYICKFGLQSSDAHRFTFPGLGSPKFRSEVFYHSKATRAMIGPPRNASCFSPASSTTNQTLELQNQLSIKPGPLFCPPALGSAPLRWRGGGNRKGMAARRKSEHNDSNV